MLLFTKDDTHIYDRIWREHLNKRSSVLLHCILNKNISIYSSVTGLMCVQIWIYYYIFLTEIVTRRCGDTDPISRALSLGFQI